MSEYITVGFFEEMQLWSNDGKAKDTLCESVDYDKGKVIEYLNNGQKIASCPKRPIDCVTGNEIDQMSFQVYTDGEFIWADFLQYHIEKYNLRLPKEFLAKVNSVN